MAENNVYISLVDEGAKINLFLSVKRVMLSRFKVNFFFLELLEFSEDRSRWESVEEKLNAIRYELLAFVVSFYRSFIHPSFRSLVVPISLSVITILALSPFLHPHLPASHLSRSLPPHLCVFFSLSHYHISPSFRPLDPTSTHSPSFPVPFFSFFILFPPSPPPSPASSRPHPTNGCTYCISLVRCVSHR